MTEQKSQTENLKKFKIWKPSFKRSISKKIAAAVSAVLVVTCVSLPSAADIPTASAEAGDKISLAMEYMGSGTAPEATGAPSASLKETGEIWLVVSAVSTDDGLKMDDANLALFTKGVYSFEMSFAYDSDYIEPHEGTSGWEEEIKTQNLSTNSASSWSSDYEIVAVSDTDINKDAAQTMPLVGTGTNWRMCTVNIRYTGEDIANARFYGMSDDGTKQYLLKMPFDVTAMPSSGIAEVIQPVLGPETFDIGSGMYGADYEGEWLDAATGAEYTNLKNVFAPSGNILLFTDGATISNIEVKKVKYTPNEEIPEMNDESFDESAVMYHDETQDGAHDFRVAQKEYYISVENEVDKVRILITAGAVVTVNSSQAQPYNIGEGANYYADIPLETLDADSLSTSDGYNVVNVNGEYTLYIRRLLKPRIEFKPGNSPYGLIERMSEANGGDWNADKVAAAKEAFEASGTVNGNVYGNHTYGAEYVPDNGQTELRYSTAAWDDFDENYDKNVNAIFVYETDTFKDPGFEMYDGLGESVILSGVTMTIKDVKILGNNKVPFYDDSEVTDTQQITADETGHFNLTGLNIRPDVYQISYKYNDSNGEPVELEETRPCIILSKRGDISLSTMPLINTTDTSNMMQRINDIVDKSVSVFKFRSADVSVASAGAYAMVNTSDTSWMRSNISSIANAYQPEGKNIPQFYNSFILQDE